MPYIDLKTNVSVSEEKKTALKSALGQAITLLPGKSEQWLMVGIQPDYSLWFQGSDAPAAMIHVEVLGAPNPSAYENMSAKLCEICAAELRIPQNRVYVCYSETANWGWNGSNF